MSSKTIVFIHGMYMTPLCWEKWIPYFEAAGYQCLAPPWPGRDKPVEELRRDSARVGSLTLSAIVDGMTREIQRLNVQPIVVGHSMGGLVTQLLLQRGLAEAGVAIDSAPPMGVLAVSWPFFKSNWPHINPFVPQDRPATMSFERFQYTFVNTLPPGEQRAAYERYVVPESRRVPAESITRTARVDFSRPHPPLLLIAGQADHLIPASLNKANYNLYKRSPSPTDYKAFPGRAHFIIGQAGWEEVAGYVAKWLTDKGL
jgi:pimeloyl-ACP methyl ester carboxylesterase